MLRICQLGLFREEDAYFQSYMMMLVFLFICLMWNQKLNAAYLDLCHGWVFPWCFLCFSMWFQEPLHCCSVADSLPAGVGSFWHRCISIQACNSPGRRATWGAGQILLCPEALHQPHYQTEVCRLQIYEHLKELLKGVFFLPVLTHRYGKRDIPDSAFTDVLMRESSESVPRWNYIRYIFRSIE